MEEKMKKKILLFLTALLFVMSSPFEFAHAMTFDLGEEVELLMDVQLIYTAGLRVADQDKTFLLNPNGDDGNRNFDQWSIINNRISTIIDMDLRYKDIGFFVRPKAFYDHVYMTDNDNDSPLTNNNFQPGLATINKTDEFDSETEDAHGRRVRLLDAFFYGIFELGDMLIDFRAGEQVIQYGESLFLSGIASTQAQADIAASVTPGAEIKEILLPSGAVSLNVDVTDTLTLGGYYKYEWEPHEFMEAGHFRSTTDFLDKAGNAIFLPMGTFSRVKDDDPSDSGQFGLKLIWQAPDYLKGTEFGLYYINYHPFLFYNLGFGLGTYNLLYWEDVMVYGASFSTELFDANVSGEISYHRDEPLSLVTGFENGNRIQAQVSWIYVSSMPGFDNMTIMGEIGATKIVGTDESKVTGSYQAWGGNLSVKPSVSRILDNLDLDIPLTYAFRPNGSLGPFTEGSENASIGLDFTYARLYKFSLKYSEYFNSKRNTIDDRDHLSFTFTYTF